MALVLLAAIFRIGSAAWASSEFSAVPNTLRLETKDGVILFGIYEKVPDAPAVVILLPMLSKTKATWAKMQEALTENGYSSIALDLRGHGESISKKGREISWSGFSNKDFQKMPLDVEAVYDFLTKKEGFRPEQIFIFGASIGANTALKFAAEKRSLGGVVLLSPGLDYRGIETVPAAKKYGNRPIYYAVSSEDLASFEAVGHLSQLTPNNTVVKLYNAGHGTVMLEKDEILLSRIILWLTDEIHHGAS